MIALAPPGHQQHSWSEVLMDIISRFTLVNIISGVTLVKVARLLVLVRCPNAPVLLILLSFTSLDCFSTPNHGLLALHASFVIVQFFHGSDSQTFNYIRLTINFTICNHSKFLKVSCSLIDPF